jgi:hypothetical protein
VEAQLASSGLYPLPSNSFAQTPILTQPYGEDSKVFRASPLPQNATRSIKVLDANSFRVASATAFTSGLGIPSSVLADLEGIPYKDALLLDTELP